MRMGLAHTGNSLTSWLAVQGQTGPMALRRSYEQNAGNLPATYAAGNAGQDWSSKVWSATSIPMDGATARLFAAGGFDARWRAYIRSLPAGARVFIAFAHEADSKINKQVAGTYTPDEFNALYARARWVLDDERTKGTPQAVTQVVLVCNLTGYYWNANGNALSQTLLDPALASADLTAADCYGMGSRGAYAVQKPYVDFCTARGYRSSIWEFSTTQAQPGGRPAWITDFVTSGYNAGHEMILGFDSGVGGSDALLSDPASLAAWSAALTQYGSPALPGTTVPPVKPPPPVRQRTNGRWSSVRHYAP